MVTLLGWGGALLALAAYSQTRVLRFRQIALLSSVALWTFAFILHFWPNVALESALGIVNARRLVQLRRPIAPRVLQPSWSQPSSPLPSASQHGVV